MNDPTLYKYVHGEKVGARLGLSTERLLVVCDGPSAYGLHPYGLDQLSCAAPSLDIVAVGNGCKHCDSNYWIGMDHPANYPVRRYSHQLCVYSERFAEWQQRRSREGVHENALFARNDQEFSPQPMSRETLVECARERGYLWHRHSLVTTLHLLIAAGAREISLVGVEARPDGVVDRFSDAFRGVQMLVEGLHHEVDIRCCSPLSPFNQFMPYRSIFELLRMPSQLPPVERWNGPMESFGILTGCDAVQEFLLPWWLANVRKHNPTVPVAVADFGMTAGARAALVEGGCVMVDVAGNAVNPWFLKPGAIARAPFSTVLWIDVDVEVRGDLVPLTVLGSTRIALAHDQLRRGEYQGGVLSVRRGDPLVRLWHEAVRHDQGSDDQHLLNALLCYLEIGPHVQELTPEWNWLVHDPSGRTCASVPEAARCVHHIGPAGKDRLRARLETMRPSDTSRQ